MTTLPVPHSLLAVRQPAGPVSQFTAERSRTRQSAGAEPTSTGRVLLHDTRQHLEVLETSSERIAAAGALADGCGTDGGGWAHAGKPPGSTRGVPVAELLNARTYKVVILLDKFC